MHQIRPLKTKTPEDWLTKLADIKERCPKSSRERRKIERISLGIVNVDGSLGGCVGTVTLENRSNELLTPL